MNFLGIGTGELLLVLLIIVLVMGPERLPELIRQWAKVAKTLSQFTRTWRQFNAELNRQLNLDDLVDDRPRPPRPKPAPPPGAAAPALQDNSIAPPDLAQKDAASQPTTVAAESTGESSASSPAVNDAPLAPAADEAQHE